MTRLSAGKRFLFVLFLIALILTALVVRPFVGALFTAAVFATVLGPLQERVSARFGDRPRTAAAAILATLALVVVLPCAWGVYAAGLQVAARVDDAMEVWEEEGLPGLVDRLPEDLRPYAIRIARFHPKLANGLAEAQHVLAGEAEVEPVPEAREQADDVPTDGEEPARDPADAQLEVAAAVTETARVSTGMLTRLAELAVDVGVMLVALFFLLVQGRDLIEWVVDAVPLPERQTRGFFAEFREVVTAVFLSTVLSAFIQTAIAAVGYLVAGMPMLLIAVLVTWIAALIPVVGGATVVVVLGAFRVMAGDTGWGLFLILWGLLPVALSDNVLKPWLAHGRLRLPAAVLFFAMLGGLAWMGPMGVIAGPLVVSFFLVVLRALDGRPTYAAGP